MNWVYHTRRIVKISVKRLFASSTLHHSYSEQVQQIISAKPDCHIGDENHFYLVLLISERGLHNARFIGELFEMWNNAYVGSFKCRHFSKLQINFVISFSQCTVMLCYCSVFQCIFQFYLFNTSLTFLGCSHSFCSSSFMGDLGVRSLLYCSI